MNPTVMKYLVMIALILSTTLYVDAAVSDDHNYIIVERHVTASGSTYIDSSLKYGGKELDRMNGLDWVDNEARMYDPLIGSTPTMDSQCERYYGISPYAWCGGNPVRYIDPSGNIIRTYMNGVAYYFKMGLDGSYGFYDKGGNLYHSDDYNDYINQLTAALEQLRTQLKLVEFRSLNIPSV